jgi:hypothetical protein
VAWLRSRVRHVVIILALALQHGACAQGDGHLRTPRMLWKHVLLAKRYSGPLECSPQARHFPFLQLSPPSQLR